MNQYFSGRKTWLAEDAKCKVLWETLVGNIERHVAELQKAMRSESLDPQQVKELNGIILHASEEIALRERLKPREHMKTINELAKGIGTDLDSLQKTFPADKYSGEAKREESEWKERVEALEGKTEELLNVIACGARSGKFVKPGRAKEISELLESANEEIALKYDEFIELLPKAKPTTYFQSISGGVGWVTSWVW